MKTSLYNTTEIDTLLTTYYLKTEVHTLLASKQNLLTNNTVDNYQFLTGNKIRNLIQGDQITLSYDENDNILIKADVSTNYKTYNELIPLFVGFPAFNSGLSLNMDVITNNPAGTGEVLLNGLLFKKINVLSPLTLTTNVDDNLLFGIDLSGYYNSSTVDTLLNQKQNLITGASSSVVNTNLSPNKVVISDTNGKISISSLQSDKLPYLSNVTSDIQTQLDTTQSIYQIPPALVYLC